MSGQRSRGDSSNVNQRIQSAAIRAMDAHSQIARAARRVVEEMDDITASHGVPLVELHEEDSVVIAVVAAREAAHK